MGYPEWKAGIEEHVRATKHTDMTVSTTIGGSFGQEVLVVCRACSNEGHPWSTGISREALLAGVKLPGGLRVRRMEELSLVLRAIVDNAKAMRRDAYDLLNFDGDDE